LKREITTLPQKGINALQNNTTLNEAIVAKAVVGTAHMGLIKKPILSHKKRILKQYHIAPVFSISIIELIYAVYDFKLYSY